MKFIRKHNKTIDRCTTRIVFSGVYNRMLNYLIERAEFLDNFIKENEDVVHDGGYYDLSGLGEELSRLVEIIRAAGVEVEE